MIADLQSAGRGGVPSTADPKPDPLKVAGRGARRRDRAPSSGDPRVDELAPGIEPWARNTLHRYEGLVERAITRPGMGELKLSRLTGHELQAAIQRYAVEHSSQGAQGLVYSRELDPGHPSPWRLHGVLTLDRCCKQRYNLTIKIVCYQISEGCNASSEAATGRSARHRAHRRA